MLVFQLTEVSLIGVKFMRIYEKVIKFSEKLYYVKKLRRRQDHLEEFFNFAVICLKIKKLKLLKIHPKDYPMLWCNGESKL